MDQRVTYLVPAEIVSELPYVRKLFAVEKPSVPKGALLIAHDHNDPMAVYFLLPPVNGQLDIDRRAGLGQIMPLGQRSTRRARAVLYRHFGEPKLRWWECWR